MLDRPNPYNHTGASSHPVIWSPFNCVREAARRIAIIKAFRRSDHYRLPVIGHVLPPSENLVELSSASNCVRDTARFAGSISVCGARIQSETPTGRNEAIIGWRYEPSFLTDRTRTRPGVRRFRHGAILSVCYLSVFSGPSGRSISRIKPFRLD